ncbi:HupE/UreJ family protein [Ruegeria sp. HKCCD6157]|uniref:HupE/UreJ family protein n=1 Tax=Ruegeria sp. HKCCD6157 TaxID=2690707 RepID=UPI0014915698|nr:HupE/UreJ family protein [Ruegeria sp. HKCCD6157]NOE27159.1 HupE/UreJ family protein [Ruegeria sp. HKCCD6157]
MRTLICFLFALLFVWPANFAAAHALDPGYLEIRQIASDTWSVHWRKPDVNGQPMAIDAVLPDGCTPARGPDPISDGRGWVSSWVVECQAGIAGQPIAIEGLETQRNDVLARMHPVDAQPTTLRFTPDINVQIIPSEQSTWSVFAAYSRLGFEHILEGWDHLLFVFALFVLVRDPWKLVGAVTAFTLAHSITLALATMGVLNVPGPPVEAVIALSIVFLAMEIVKGGEGRFRLSKQKPWIVCFGFGLLHGLGFAGALADIGLPPDDIPAALLAFNLGVEAGQLSFIAALALLMATWRLIALPVGKHATVLTAYGIGSVSMYWLIERVSGF